MISSVSTTRHRRIRSIAAMVAVGAAVAVQFGSAQLASAAPAAVTAAAGASTGGPPVCVTTDVYVTDNSAFGANNGGLIHVTKSNGARNSLSENNNPVGGPSFETPWGMTSDANGDLLVAEQAMVGATPPGLIRVDKATGVRTLLSNNTTPAGGPDFSTPSGIAVEADGSILVADLSAFPKGGGGAGGVIRVDPVTGVRTTLSRNGSPAGGPAFDGPMDIAVADSGDIYVANTFGNTIMKVDPVTGARTLVSRNNSPAGGPSFVWPWGMTMAPDGDILISDSSAFGGDGGIIRVDPATGARSTLSSNTSPAGGPSFDHPGDLIVDRCGHILVTDSGAEAIYQVDRTTGTRTTVSDNTSSGSPAYAWPMGIAATSLVVDIIDVPLEPGLPGLPG